MELTDLVEEQLKEWNISYRKYSYSLTSELRSSFLMDQYDFIDVFTNSIVVMGGLIKATDPNCFDKLWKALQTRT